MGHFFDAPNQPLQPKEAIRIENVIATPYEDRFRVYVEVKVTQFAERPNLLLVTRDMQGNVVTELDIIATMHADMEFTLHMRGMDDPAGTYELTVELFYETRNPPQDKQVIQFEIPEAEFYGCAF